MKIDFNCRPLPVALGHYFNDTKPHEEDRLRLIRRISMTFEPKDYWEFLRVCEIDTVHDVFARINPKLEVTVT